MNKKDNIDIEPEDLKKLAVKTDKVSKIVTAVNSSIIALLICFNTYYNVFYYKPTKRKNDKSNLLLLSCLCKFLAMEINMPKNLSRN